MGNTEMKKFIVKHKEVLCCKNTVYAMDEKEARELYLRLISEGKISFDEFDSLDSEDIFEEDESKLDEAMDLINVYCQTEFQEEAKFSNLENVGLAYTTTDDSAEMDIAVFADLVHFRIDSELGGRLVERHQYRSMDELIENELMSLSFDDLVYFDKDVIKEAEDGWWNNPERAVRFNVVEIIGSGKTSYAIWDGSKNELALKNGEELVFDDSDTAEQYCRLIYNLKHDNGITSDSIRHNMHSFSKEHIVYALKNGSIKVVTAETNEPVAQIGKYGTLFFAGSEGEGVTAEEYLNVTPLEDVAQEIYEVMQRQAECNPWADAYFNLLLSDQSLAKAELQVDETEQEYTVSMAVDGRIDITVRASGFKDAFEKAELAFELEDDLSKMEIVGSKPVNAEREDGEFEDYNG